MKRVFNFLLHLYYLMQQGFGIYNVKYYGAKGDGVTDDGPAIALAIAAVRAVAGGTVYFGVASFLINTFVPLPTTGGQNHAVYQFIGYGAVLKTTAAIVMIGDTVPVNVSAAVNNANRKLHFKGLHFQGNLAAGQSGLQPIGSYGLVVEDCVFESFDTGLDLVFALMGEIKNTVTRDCVSYDIRIRSAVGVVTGATHSNSAANSTRLSRWRSYARAGALAQLQILGSDNVVLDGCITEGANPINAVEFDWGGSTTCKEFSVRNHHAENTPSGAHFRVTAGGQCHFDYVQCHTSGTLVDGTGSNNAAVILVSTPYLTAGTKFTNGGNYSWVFEFPAAYGSADLTAAGYWNDGSPPAYMLTIGNTGAFGGTHPALTSGSHLLIKALQTLSLSAGTDANVRLTLNSRTGILLGSTLTSAALLSSNYGVFSKDEANGQLVAGYKYNAGTYEEIRWPLGRRFQKASQAIAYAASITPNPANGRLVVVGTLTGGITVNAPASPLAGDELVFSFTQDGVGGRVVTLNAVFKANWTPDTAAGKINTISFIYDGTNWLQTQAATGL